MKREREEECVGERERKRESKREREGEKMRETEREREQQMINKICWQKVTLHYLVYYVTKVNNL